MSVPIRVLSSTLTVLTEIDTYENFYYTQGLYSAGSWELTINQNIFDDRGQSYADYLAQGAFLQVGSDLSKIGRILEIERQEGEQGKGSQKLIARGAQAKVVLNQRIIYPGAGANYSATGVSETVLKNLLISQIGSGAAAARQMGYVNVTSSAGRGTSLILTARYQGLLDKCNEYCQSAGIGIKFTLNPSTVKLDIDTIHGTDRTFGQSTNPKVIFSSDFDSIKQATWKRSVIPYKTTAIIGGQGIGASRAMRYIGDSLTGFDRYETFVDARELTTSGDLDAKGTAELAGLSVQNFLDAKALTFSKYVLGTDYNLGDLVTIQTYGQAFDVRICEVQESWSTGQYDIVLTFGSKYPELPSQMARGAAKTTMALNNSES
jgi:hypothetical protein